MTAPSPRLRQTKDGRPSEKHWYELNGKKYEVKDVWLGRGG
jgi:hypothetical protein